MIIIIMMMMMMMMIIMMIIIIAIIIMINTYFLLRFSFPNVRNQNIGFENGNMSSTSEK